MAKQQELERLIEEIKSEKIKSILKAGSSRGDDLRRVFIDPALETLAREVIRLEKEAEF